MPFECIKILDQYSKMNVINVMDYGVKGDGISNDLAGIQNAINVAVNKVLYFPSGTYLINGNLTIGTNIKVKMANGAVIKPVEGKTIVINGELEAGSYKIFDISAGSCKVSPQVLRDILPQWWGAVGDGVTECSTAILAAAESAVGGTLLFLPGTYSIGNHVSIGNNVNICVGGDVTFNIATGKVFSFTGTFITPLVMKSTGGGTLDISNAKKISDNALLADGSVALTNNWNAGNYELAARTLRSTVSSGTPPISVTSTTQVNNLNADMLDGLHASEISSGTGIGIDVKAYGAVGDGTTDDTASIQNAIAAAGNKTLYFPPGTYYIASSITVPSNVKVIIGNGAMVRPAFGRMFTINGPFEAGLHQVFDNVNGCTNGTFENATGWTVGTGCTIAGGVAQHTIGNTGTLSFAACAGVSGKRFLLRYTVGGTPNGGIIPSIGGVSGYRRSAPGTYVDIITATGTGALTFTPENNFGGTLDNVEVYMLGSQVLGAGAVEKVLPQWWGAKGDDSTDCALAFNMALEETRSDGYMFIPNGTYRVSYPISNFPLDFSNVLTSAIRISGASRNSTIIKYMGSDDRYAIEIIADRPSVLGGSSPYMARIGSYITVENIQVQANNTNSAGGAIVLGGTYSVELDTLGITNVQNGTGILCRPSEALMRSTGRVNNTDREFTTSNQKYAIRFTVLTNAGGAVSRVSVRLKRTGNPSGTVTASIYSNSGGVPGSQIGKTSNPINSSSLSDATDGSEQTFIFEITDGVNALPSITSGGTFWLVLETTDTSGVILRTRSSDTSGGFAVFDGSNWTATNDGSDIVVVSHSYWTALPYVKDTFIGAYTGAGVVNFGIRIINGGQCVLQNSRLRANYCIYGRGYSLFWMLNSELSVDPPYACINMMARAGKTRYIQSFIEKGSVALYGGTHFFTSTHLGVYPVWYDNARVHISQCETWVPRMNDPTHVFDFKWIIPSDDSRITLYGNTPLVDDADALTGKALRLSSTSTWFRYCFGIGGSEFQIIPPRGIYLCTVYVRAATEVTEDLKIMTGHLSLEGVPTYSITNLYTPTTTYRPYMALLYVTSSNAAIGRGMFFAVQKDKTTANEIFVSHAFVQRLGDISLDTMYVNDFVAHNPEVSSADGARNCGIRFIGRRSSSQHLMAMIQASHDGNSDDEKGRLEFFVNSGSEKFVPTRMMQLSSSGLAIGTAGSAMKQVATGTVSIDPPSIAGNSQGTVTFTKHKFLLLRTSHAALCFFQKSSHSPLSIKMRIFKTLSALSLLHLIPRSFIRRHISISPALSAEPLPMDMPFSLASLYQIPSRLRSMYADSFLR